MVLVRSEAYAKEQPAMLLWGVSFCTLPILPSILSADVEGTCNDAHQDCTLCGWSPATVNVSSTPGPSTSYQSV